MFDVKDPAPRQVIDEESPGQGAADAGEGEDPAEVALIAATLARAHDVADDGHGQRHQSPTAQSLQGPERDELVHVPGQADKADPMRKMTMATWKIFLRP